MGCSSSKGPSAIHSATTDAIAEFSKHADNSNVTFEICSPGPDETTTSSTSNPKTLSFGCVDTIGRAFSGVLNGPEGEPMLEYGVRTCLPGLKKLKTSKVSNKSSQISAGVSDDDLEADRVQLITAGMSYVVYAEGVYPREGIVIACKTVKEDGVSTKPNESEVDGMLILRYFPKGFKYTHGSFTEGFRWPMKWIMSEELKWCHGPETPFGGLNGNKVQTEFTRRGELQEKMLNKELKKDVNAGCWDISGGVLFLVAIAVKPSSQGTGLGGKLMKLVCNVADKMGVEKTYLECSAGKRETIYGKYGFKTVCRGKVRDEKGIAMMKKEHGLSDYDEEDFEAIGMVRERTII